MTDQMGKSSEPGAAAVKPAKGRSPNYPGISLPKAIELAQTVYDDVAQHELPVASLTSKWGFKKPTTGPASTTYAAMKKYGLIEDHGTGDSRVGKLTDLAVEILHPSSPDRQGAIQRAALNPAIHKEWWERYRLKIPPWEALEWDLVEKGPWTATGLRGFLREYRETMTFAKLDPAGKVAREEPTQEGDNGDQDPRPEDGTGGHDRQQGQQRDDQGQGERPVRDRLRRSRAGDVKTYAIPVDADHDAMIELPTPMTPARWKNFQKFLTAMEAIIVEADEDASHDES